MIFGRIQLKLLLRNCDSRVVLTRWDARCQLRWITYATSMKVIIISLWVFKFGHVLGISVINLSRYFLPWYLDQLLVCTPMAMMYYSNQVLKCGVSIPSYIVTECPQSRFSEIWWNLVKCWSTRPMVSTLSVRYSEQSQTAVQAFVIACLLSCSW